MNHQPIPVHQLPTINKHWTLFLDRDGVINTDVVDDYIKSWDDFFFTEGCLDALQLLRPLFGRIVVISNQRGVGRGLMTQETLDIITENMLTKIEEAGGGIDKVYYCTATDNTDYNRKPNTGMAMQAQHDFPEINFTKTIMVGNMPGDMQFGRNIGAFNIFIPTRKDGVPDAGTVDASYKDLLAFAQELFKASQTQ